MAEHSLEDYRDAGVLTDTQSVSSRDAVSFPGPPRETRQAPGLDTPVKEPNCTLALSEPLGTEWCLPVACGYHRKIQTNGNVLIMFLCCS